MPPEIINIMIQIPVVAAFMIFCSFMLKNFRSFLESSQKQMYEYVATRDKEFTASVERTSQTLRLLVREQKALMFTLHYIRGLINDKPMGPEFKESMAAFHNMIEQHLQE